MWDDTLFEPNQAAAIPQEAVLVVVVPAQRDWELIQREHWYRIPVNRAPAELAVSYLAFYLTAHCEARWMISHYAPVLGYHLHKRRELLPEEASHPRADQLYYKVELGALEALPEPILSRKLRRITFISTTLDRLLQAREVNDLWERGASKARLEQILALHEWLYWHYY